MPNVLYSLMPLKQVFTIIGYFNFKRKLVSRQKHIELSIQAGTRRRYFDLHNFGL